MRALAALVLCCEVAIAQTDAIPKFEVGSIKRSAPDSETFIQARPGGRLDISRATLKTLTAFAWRLQSFQVSGGPAWVRSEHFNIQAKAIADPGEDKLLLMTQALLAERFSLKLHFETKEQPVYFLVVSQPGKRPPTGLRITTDPSTHGSVGLGMNHLEALEIPMARLAEVLSRVLDRNVVDRTGRTENFNVSLHWAPDEHQALPSNDAIELPPSGSNSASGSNRVKLLSSSSSSTMPRDPATSETGWH
jgi:uncharacterized protein (TIGR03435 family)